MPRIKIDLPENLHLVCSLPVRITDLNYGGHVGNDRIVALLHEGRVQFLKALGYGELEVESVGLIMSDLAVSFQVELFYGDTINVYMKAADFTRVGFDFYYRLSKTSNEKEVTVVTAKTGMVCFDYAKKKPVTLPDQALGKLKAAI